MTILTKQHLSVSLWSEQGRTLLLNILSRVANMSWYLSGKKKIHVRLTIIL